MAGDTIGRADIAQAALEGADELVAKLQAELTQARRDLYHTANYARAEARLARDEQKKSERWAAQQADNPRARLQHLQDAALFDAKATVAEKILGAVTARLEREDGDA